MSTPPEPDDAGHRAVTRRSVLAGAVAVAATGALGRPATAATPRRGATGAVQPRVAIIGAGLAGLTCAFRLHQKGIASIVYEAHSSRIGGRCWTARGFGAGQTGEHGGEFIDTVHYRIRSLAAELGLSLDDVIKIEDAHPRWHKRIYLDGAVRRASEVYAHQNLLTSKAKADLARIGDYRWNHAGTTARAFDEMTGRQWLDLALPDPEDRLLRLATDQFMSEEYGLDADRLSAISMVTAFAPGGLPSDERFHVHGGNDQIPHGMVDLLPSGTVVLDTALQAISRRSDASYELMFTNRAKPVIADVVVFCVPFTTLRLVDLDGLGLSIRKRRCIDELGMGTDAKVLIPIERHLAAYDHWDGEYYDEHIDTWDSTLGQTGKPALLTVYAGGRFAERYPATDPHAAAPANLVSTLLTSISRAVPGLADGYAGHAWLDRWVDDPWVQGSYAAFLPGQFTRYWGFVGRAEGRLHFGGEHTSMSAQGYLEGAVRSGERCAREVRAGLT